MMMGENKNKDPAGVPRERTGRLDLNEEEYVPEVHGETWEGGDYGDDEGLCVLARQSKHTQRTY